MALLGITKNLRDAVITVKDGTIPTPAELELVLDEGDLAFTVTKNKIVVMDRGKLSHRRGGDEQEIDLSFSAKYTRGFSNTASPAGAPTLADAMLRTGGAAAWVSAEDAAAGNLPSAGPAGSELYSVNIDFEINDPTGGKTELLQFYGFHADTVDFAEGDEYDTISVKGTCLQVNPDIANP